VNPDQGNPLAFDVELVSASLKIPIAKGIQGNNVAFTLGNIVPTGSKIGIFRIKVTASSIDKVIQGSAFSPFLMKKIW